MRLTRILLIILLLAVTAAGLFGAASILIVRSPDWRIFAGMLTIGLFSLTSLGCGFVLERRVMRPLMLGGIVVSAVGLAVYQLAIWADWNAGEEFLGTIAIWSIAIPLFGLEGLTRFDNAWRFVRLATLAMIVLMAAAYTIVLIASAGDDTVGRLLASGTIVTVLGMIATPVLYKIAGAEVKPPPETTRLEMAVECPRCLTRQRLPRGRSRCSNCRLRFNIDIEEPRCPGCGYLLYQLTTPRCPECGRELAEADVLAPPAPPPVPAAAS